PSVVAQGYLAVGAWISGRADEAERRAESLVEFARECGHPYSLGLALLLAAWVRQLRREREQARTVAEALIAVAREQGFPEWLAWGEFVRGWGRAGGGGGWPRTREKGGGERASG